MTFPHDRKRGSEQRLGGGADQLPALILMVLASACSALGTVSRSTPFVRLASILSGQRKVTCKITDLVFLVNWAVALRRMILDLGVNVEGSPVECDR